MPDNKTIARRFFEELWNEEKLAVADDIIGADAVGRNPGALPHGGYPDFEKRIVVMLHRAFPDLHTTIEEQVAEGETVVTRWTQRGTHRGEFFGIAPTGKAVTGAGVHIQRIKEGKIVEIWALTDAYGVLQQLGKVPELPAIPND
jgi:predicted ester cyclase